MDVFPSSDGVEMRRDTRKGGSLVGTRHVKAGSVPSYFASCSVVRLFQARLPTLVLIVCDEDPWFSADRATCSATVTLVAAPLTCTTLLSAPPYQDL